MWRGVHQAGLRLDQDLAETTIQGGCNTATYHHEPDSLGRARQLELARLRRLAHSVAAVPVAVEPGRPQFHRQQQSRLGPSEALGPTNLLVVHSWARVAEW
jgi:hypothetical protein